MALRDGRRTPFCYQEVDALAAIRERDRGKGDVQLAYALAVYCAMTEIANEQRDRGGFRATRRQIADRSGTSIKTVDRVVTELEEAGLLEVERRGERGEASLWALLTLGATPTTRGGDSDDTGGAPPETPPSNTGQKSGSSSSSSAREMKPAELAATLRDAEVPGEMVADAASLLRGGRKVDGRLVTAEEMASAAAALAAFNREFEWNGRKGADFGLAAALTSIVMRVRERPSWDLAKHVRLVESAWRIRWWERNGKKRRPNPNVIWGERAFEQVVMDAKEEAQGGIAKVERRYTRKNRG